MDFRKDSLTNSRYYIVVSHTHAKITKSSSLGESVAVANDLTRTLLLPRTASLISLISNSMYDTLLQLASILKMLSYKHLIRYLFLTQLMGLASTPFFPNPLLFLHKNHRLFKRWLVILSLLKYHLRSPPLKYISSRPPKFQGWRRMSSYVSVSPIIQDNFRRHNWRTQRKITLNSPVVNLWKPLTLTLFPSSPPGVTDHILNEQTSVIFSPQSDALMVKNIPPPCPQQILVLPSSVPNSPVIPPKSVMTQQKRQNILPIRNSVRGRIPAKRFVNAVKILSSDPTEIRNNLSCLQSQKSRLILSLLLWRFINISSLLK